MTPNEVQSIWEDEFRKAGPRDGMSDVDHMRALADLVQRVTIRTLSTDAINKAPPLDQN